MRAQRRDAAHHAVADRSQRRVAYRHRQRRSAVTGADAAQQFVHVERIARARRVKRRAQLIIRLGDLCAHETAHRGEAERAERDAPGSRHPLKARKQAGDTRRFVRSVRENERDREIRNPSREVVERSQ